MARPHKEGLNYFPFDVDFFEDDKLQLINAEFGGRGVLIAIKLLCKIYKEKGYYYQWGDDQCLLFSAGAAIVPGIVNEVVTGLVRRSFFDKRVFDSFGVLTSIGIQRRYFEASLRREKITVFSEYLVIDNINSVNVNIISVKTDIGTQSKVKERKEERERAREEVEAFVKFQDWVKENAPRVNQLKQPFTIDEFFKLKDKLPNEMVRHLLITMQNYKPLLSKSISAYLTILNWSKRENSAAEIRNNNGYHKQEPERVRRKF
jgi:hypothetical protein